ncbi:MAG: magnesium transporter [Gammaproteobacteria bacterium]|nr:MAG: magnesium transporter [Gammaproteobacteria bacterium]
MTEKENYTATANTTIESALNNALNALNSGRFNDVRQLLQALYPEEIADILESLPLPQRKLLWKMVRSEFEGDILVEVTDEVRDSLLEDMSVKEIIDATKNLAEDDIADFIQSLPEQILNQVLQSMDQENRQRIERVLSYPEDSAGGIMDLDTISIRSDVNCDVVLRFLRKRGEIPKYTNILAVVNHFGKFQGTLSIRKLLTADGNTNVVDIMRDNVKTITADKSALDAARLFERLDLVSLIVVDDKNQVIGRITVDDAMDVLADEAEHSLKGAAGLSEEDDIFLPAFKSSKRRAVWLGINLITAFIASWVIGQFQDVLQQLISLAVLMPIVASMGGIAGSQTLTLVIRGQALGQINKSNARWILTKEIAVSIINGILWASVIGFISWWWFSQFNIGFIIATAIIINLFIASLSGVFIPIILKKLKIDAALAGGVILTTITDVMGFLSFLGLASIYLKTQV